MKLSRLITIAILAVALLCGQAGGQNIETGFLNRTVSVNGSEYRYVVYVPREFSRKKVWPVIMVLHGGGMYGNDGLIQTEGGLARAIRMNPQKYPVIVVWPQAHADGTPGWQLEGGTAALAALDATVKEFNGDPARLILAGHSAGGNGAWSLASRFPEKWAAVVTIAAFVDSFKGKTSGVDYPSLAPVGSGDVFAYVAKRVKGIPIWIFNGDADTNVDVSQSRKLVAALKAIGADFRYTEYQGLDHNTAGVNAYSSSELIEWMLRQRRP